MNGLVQISFSHETQNYSLHRKFLPICLNPNTHHNRFSCPVRQPAGKQAKLGETGRPVAGFSDEKTNKAEDSDLFCEASTLQYSVDRKRAQTALEASFSLQKDFLKLVPKDRSRHPDTPETVNYEPAKTLYSNLYWNGIGCVMHFHIRRSSRRNARSVCFDITD